MNPDYSLADWVNNRGTLTARKPPRAPGPIWGGSHCRPKLNLSVARFSGLGSELCVPNLHIAHFCGAEEDAYPAVRRIFSLAS